MSVEALHESKEVIKMVPAEQELRKLMVAPGTPFWVQDLIKTALDKDCVDAANCLTVVADLFDKRATQIIKGEQQLLFNV
jgi:hypothetical protein